MTKDYLAIDVGGTRLKVGLIDRSGNILEKFSERTNTAGLEAFWDNCEMLSDVMMAKFEVLDSACRGS